jgi:hypothetical protein
MLLSFMLSFYSHCRIHNSKKVVLYGCETWSVTLREEYRLRVFENRVLRRMFGPQRDEVTGGWGEVHNKGLHNLYSSPSFTREINSRRMRWTEHVACMGKTRNAKSYFGSKA